MRRRAIRALSFTGSTRVGRLLMEQSAKSYVKRLSLELGGNAPFIVGPDMDPKEAAYAAVECQVSNSGAGLFGGQPDSGAHESIHDAFVEQFTERMAALTVGNGLQGEIDLGPLIHRQAVEKAALDCR